MREFKTKLQIQFENVEESYFETQNIKLVETTEESIEEQIDVFRQEYKIIIERITEKLNNYNLPQTIYSNIKLQEIKIPMFYGEMKEWSSFHDLFKSLVHDSKHFTEAEKMFRLKTSLGGEAGRLIQHLPVTATNYEAAWQILKERYENRRLQFTAQVDRLLDQPTANGESAQSMKQLLDTTKECIYALKGLNLNLNDEQAIIARIVVRKLDKESLRLYEQNVKKSRDIQSLDDVFSFLEQQYQALEAICDRKPTKWNNQKQPQRTPTFYTAAQNNCVYCKVPGHQIGECRKFQTLTTMNRRRFITNNKLCYICLDHVYEGKCNNKKKCNKCERNHHNLLHFNEFQKGKGGSEKNVTKTSSTMMTKHSEMAILIATAQIRVKAANGEYVTLRALIDQGSQKTTISEEASQILHLPRRREVTELQGLGNTTVGVSKFKINIKIKPRFLSNEAYNVEALILPKLASAQPDKTFK
uniref:Peptidase A2 domain-containing protein n=1 Tax=Bactrocera latifrons TaxID=174628 RepID=A0A0K8TXJ5_BACLA